uniref:Wall-associated receptor kinase-like 20 n=1 Tax=Rhizophora mucronata TaxID=61149 RepID=A0A2P2P0G5_RHIMU
MKPPPPPPYALFLAAAMLLTSATCVCSANHCPNCGSTAVPYPLSTGPLCGDQLYKIRCNAGSLLFDTVNSSYPIVSIDPLSQRLVIQPASLEPNTCVTSDFIHRGIQLNGSLPFSITKSNTVMLLNCSETLLLSPLNCSSTSLCHSYVNRTRTDSVCRNASICCTFTPDSATTSHMIRVHDVGCKAYNSFVNLDPDLPVDKWPDPGVEIEWALPQEPLCGSQGDCDQNSTCGPDPNVEALRRCYCKGGFSWNPIQGACFKNVTCQNHEGCGRSSKTALVAGTY